MLVASMERKSWKFLINVTKVIILLTHSVTNRIPSCCTQQCNYGECIHGPIVWPQANFLIAFLLRTYFLTFTSTCQTISPMWFATHFDQSHSLNTLGSQYNHHKFTFCLCCKSSWFPALLEYGVRICSWLSLSGKGTIRSHQMEIIHKIWALKHQIVIFHHFWSSFFGKLVIRTFRSNMVISAA